MSRAHLIFRHVTVALSGSRRLRGEWADGALGAPPAAVHTAAPEPRTNTLVLSGTRS
jgi:hypothetical protein